MRSTLLAATILTTLWFTAPASAVEIKVLDDPYKDRIEYATPKKEITVGDPLEGDHVSWFLVGTRERATNKVLVSLAVNVGYQDITLRRYNAVNVLGGKVVKGEALDQSVLGCSASALRGCRYFEALSFDIPNDLVKSWASTGISLKLAGDMVVDGTIIELTADEISSMTKATGL